ncbi:hypothetical protein BDV96DRAFT_591319 [Lophiotrema nucula]|uniref:Uncharacterized protein n=1 Tax=Lophiotrema nucula TaxID=690887 RepID=A0A6A5YJ69_9PLEO|nr:hypothetical protein BDV96DRAFT_591319 [Lophiotrema nucula]
MKTSIVLFTLYPATMLAQKSDLWTSTSSSASATEDNFFITATASCEPHGDHWHCPSGVAEPTTPPAITTSESHTNEDDHEHEATATTCEPHGDHWLCPSGVAEPTTIPAAVTMGGEGTAASVTAIPTGGASRVRGLKIFAPMVGVVGAVLG